MFVIASCVGLQWKTVLWLKGGPLSFLLAGWVVGVKSQMLHVINTGGSFTSYFPEEVLPGHKTTRLCVAMCLLLHTSEKSRKKTGKKNWPATAAPTVLAWCTCWHEATGVLVCVRVFSPVLLSQDLVRVFTWEAQRGATEVGSALSRSAEHYARCSSPQGALALSVSSLLSVFIWLRVEQRHRSIRRHGRLCQQRNRVIYPYISGK